MAYRYLLRALVLITAISLFSGTKTVGFQSPQTRSVDSLLHDLYASIEDGTVSYQSITIVNQLARLGPQASPAVDVLIDLLAKPFADCEEQLRVCPNNAPNCLKESKTCPADAEMRNYDYLTVYAFAALKQIGVAALPKLSVALDVEARNEESSSRRRFVAGVIGEIGPAAIPFLTDKLRDSDYSKKRLALEALHTVLARDSSSGNELTGFVPYITPFLNGDFETTDQAIYILGAIGPGAAEAVPRLIDLLNYKRVLHDRACPVGERIGYIFQPQTIDALMKIGTPEAIRAVEQIEKR
jgi:hypothetical protein